MGYSLNNKTNQIPVTAPKFAANTRHPPSEQRARHRVVIGIPTVGRAAILASTVKAIASQNLMPDLVLISIADPEDADSVGDMQMPFPIRILTGEKGLTTQRNRILDELRKTDLILFLDDDFLMAPDYVEQMVQVFENNADVVLATGNLIADGIIGPGFDHATGQDKLAEGLAETASPELAPAHTGYGCNMGLRAKTILERNLRFDEALPLYSWLEDVDFSNRLASHGRFVRPGGMRGVHLGTKSGRTHGRYLGYSQIANPVYLIRKGTISRKRARDLMLRNVASNLVGTIRPRPWADYRGRLVGNLIALGDVLTGRVRPDRILNLRS